jgi:hypothetical protein
MCLSGVLRPLVLFLPWGSSGTHEAFEIGRHDPVLLSDVASHPQVVNSLPPGCSHDSSLPSIPGPGMGKSTSVRQIVKTGPVQTGCPGRVWVGVSSS